MQSGADRPVGEKKAKETKGCIDDCADGSIRCNNLIRTLKTRRPLSLPHVPASLSGCCATADGGRTNGNSKLDMMPFHPMPSIFALS
jgi:hypothetical protein